MKQLPRHGSFSHETISSRSTKQSPLLHVRVLLRLPDPHVTLHGDQFSQLPNTPVTFKINNFLFDHQKKIQKSNAVAIKNNNNTNPKN